MNLGIERLLADPALRAPLAGKRVALLAHPASVTRDLTHSLDALAALGDVKLSAAFGPQHGLRGDKQDNMIETEDYIDPVHGIPVFSLYGEVRRPTGQMMTAFDVILIDLQDVGCRIYTFITTLLYMLEAAAEHGKAVWVLDRPNPAGRPVEGTTLIAGLGELRRRGADADAPRPDAGRAGPLVHRPFQARRRLSRHRDGGLATPTPRRASAGRAERIWINPSPNAPNLYMARGYAGTVMLEGATLSEGRGTTRPLELFGAPDIDARAVIAHDARAGAAVAGGLHPARHLVRADLPQACRATVQRGAYPRRGRRLRPSTAFKPWRVQALGFKAIRRSIPTMTCGATSRTNTPSGNCRST